MSEHDTKSEPASSIEWRCLPGENQSRRKARLFALGLTTRGGQKRREWPALPGREDFPFFLRRVLRTLGYRYGLGRALNPTEAAFVLNFDTEAHQTGVDRVRRMLAGRIRQPSGELIALLHALEAGWTHPRIAEYLERRMRRHSYKLSCSTKRVSATPPAPSSYEPVGAHPHVNRNGDWPEEPEEKRKAAIQIGVMVDRARKDQPGDRQVAPPEHGEDG